MFSVGGRANMLKPIQTRRKELNNYVPKLVPYLMAESNVSQQTSDSQSSSRILTMHQKFKDNGSIKAEHGHCPNNSK
jgi:hypothetical protein